MHAHSRAAGPWAEGKHIRQSQALMLQVIFSYVAIYYFQHSKNLLKLSYWSVVYIIVIMGNLI